MAGIPVNNNLNALSRMVNKAAGAQGSQTAPYANASYTKQEEALKDSFDRVMNRVNSQAKPADVRDGGQTAARTQTTAKTGTTAKAQTAADSRTLSSGAAEAGSGKQDTAKAEETGSKAADVSGNGKTADAASNDDALQNAAEEAGAVEEPVQDGMTDTQKEALTEAGEKLVEDVAEEMGVTPEEVEEAIAVLGLTAVQLLDPENMKLLVLAISGNEDQMSIITDGELYGHLQKLLDAVSVSLNELGAELGLSGEELKELAAQMAAAEDGAGAVEVPEELTAEPETAGTAQTAEPGNAALEGMKDYAVTVHRDGDEVKVKVQVDNTGANQSVREEVTQTSEVQAGNEAKPDNRESFGENRGGEGSMQDAFMMQTPAEQTATVEAAAETQAMERFTSTEEIMNQITEYIKINLKSDVQEMELQLHPASLGSVNVQLAAKDGVITAQFTAQNETVKAAIESQLVQLRTQFEEQGIKVDAVEVTVANYRFEQSFSGKEEQSEADGRNGKKGPRRINLNDMNPDELPEDMEDSERIAADMMARSGNTVDYTA